MNEFWQKHHEALVIGVEDDRFVVVLSHYFVTADEVIWVDWSLYYSVANADGPPEVFVGDGCTEDFALASLRASGHVKWDGCHEIDVEDYHGCRPGDLDVFLRAVASATRAAAGLLTRSEYEWGAP